MKLTQSQDIYYMNIALNVAKTGIGLTGENPSVGCLIVQDKVIIARSLTGLGGTPHAECIAIKKAGALAENATMYVTLEPCCHYGKTSPCTDEIIKSRIKRVVIAAQDPDERVNGKSTELLHKNGIIVDVGILKDKAQAANIGYFYRKIHKRPFITLKIATTLDGKIACSNSESKWISSSNARKFTHKIRARSDAIMIGKGTLEKDNPFLDCYLPRMEHVCATKIIIDSKGNINNPGLNIFKKGRVWSFGAKNDFEHENFQNFPIDVKGDGVDLEQTVVKLAYLGINNLLVEGGSQIASSLLKKNLIDKIIWVRSNTIAGDDAIGAFAELGLTSPDEFYRFKKMRTVTIGGDTVDFLIK